ncbi:mechanosensitive ion channel family protein [Lactococcus raffinolactis]|uniref:mechanosensitive ion channel family protein n=1 Tax=Pseudolactococcus raffinolactis TaxID=1366 RepID=UPI001428BE48|nr:mechanosensitive ion channel family protein [Lactococcus raffinolactis]
MSLLKYLHLETLFDTAVEKIIYVIIASVLFFIFYRILKRIIKHLFDNYSRINIADSARVLTLSRLTLSVFQYLTDFLYIYTILGIFGLPVASLLAGAGIVGVGLGFAGRDLMTDIINGFFIIVEHQVNVGDTVNFKNLDITGTVMVIGIRSLTLKTSAGALVFVPNRNITALANLSRLDHHIFLDVPVTEENVTDVKQRMLSVNKNYPNAAFVGVQIVDEKVYLRSQLTGTYREISEQKAQILSQYYGLDD